MWFQLQQAQKKKEETKRARDDKDKVMDMLFSAFEKHQYYNVRDLVKITKQPVVSPYVLLLWYSFFVYCFLYIFLFYLFSSHPMEFLHILKSLMSSFQLLFI